MKHFVATANSLDVWLSGKESCSTPSHRIGVVDNPSVGANIHDVIGKIGQNRDYSNGASNAAGPCCVSNTLLDTVFLWNLEVDEAVLRRAGFYGNNNEIGTIESSIKARLDHHFEFRDGFETGQYVLADFPLRRRRFSRFS